MYVTLAKKTQVEQLVEIVQCTFHLACPKDSNGDLQTNYIAKNLSVDNFSQFISSDNYMVLVAIEEFQPVGLAVLEKVSNNVGMLSKLYVLPKCHGKGVAAELLNEVFNRAKESGYNQLNLCVYSGNLKAKTFYEKHGFIHKGECDFEMETELHIDHVYALNLG